MEKQNRKPNSDYYENKSSKNESKKKFDFWISLIDFRFYIGL